MDAYPLGMDPGTKIHYRCKLVGIRFLPGGQYCVKFPDQRVKLSFKASKLFGNLSCIYAVMGADSHLDVFEARFTAERANKTCVGHGEVLHEEGLPVLRRCKGREFPPLSGENNLIENLAEVTT
jgi:hypothetical protein